MVRGYVFDSNQHDLNRNGNDSSIAGATVLVSTGSFGGHGERSIFFLLFFLLLEM